MMPVETDDILVVIATSTGALYSAAASWQRGEESVYVWSEFSGRTPWRGLLYYAACFSPCVVSGSL